MFPNPSLLEFHEVIRKLTRLPLKLPKVLNHTGNTTHLRHQFFLMLRFRPGPVRKTNHQNNHRDAKKNERHFEFLLSGTLKHFRTTYFFLSVCYLKLSCCAVPSTPLFRTPTIWSVSRRSPWSLRTVTFSLRFFISSSALSNNSLSTA